MRTEDAEQAFTSSLESPSRQLLQLGIELPTSVESLKESLEKRVGCKDADGVITRSWASWKKEDAEDSDFSMASTMMTFCSA